MKKRQRSRRQIKNHHCETKSNKSRRDHVYVPAYPFRCHTRRSSNNPKQTLTNVPPSSSVASNLFPQARQNRQRCEFRDLLHQDAAVEERLACSGRRQRQDSRIWLQAGRGHGVRWKRREFLPPWRVEARAGEFEEGEVRAVVPVSTVRARCWMLEHCLWSLILRPESMTARGVMGFEADHRWVFYSHSSR